MFSEVYVKSACLSVDISVCLFVGGSVCPSVYKIVFCQSAGGGIKPHLVTGLVVHIHSGFYAVSTEFQLFNGDSSQTHASWTIFNHYLTSPLF